MQDRGSASSWEDKWVRCSITEGRQQGDWGSIIWLTNRWQPSPPRSRPVALHTGCMDMCQVWALHTVSLAVLISAAVALLQSKVLSQPDVRVGGQQISALLWNVQTTPSTPAPSFLCTKSQVQHVSQAWGSHWFWPPSPPAGWLFSMETGAAVSWDLVNELIGAGWLRLSSACMCQRVRRERRRKRDRRRERGGEDEEDNMDLLLKGVKSLFCNVTLCHMPVDFSVIKWFTFSNKCTSYTYIQTHCTCLIHSVLMSVCTLPWWQSCWISLPATSLSANY